MTLKSAWHRGDDYRGRRQARRSRRQRPCITCSWPEYVTRIEPGDIYLHLVLFPRNDVWDNRVPITASECASCARKYDRGHLIDEREANPR